MNKLILAIVGVVAFAGIGFAEMNFEVIDGKAIITETKLAQPVPMQGQNGQVVALPGATSDITTKYAPLTREQAQTQVAQLTAKKAAITKNYNDTISIVNENIAFLNSIIAAIPETIIEPIIEG